MKTLQRILPYYEKYRWLMIASYVAVVANAFFNLAVPQLIGRAVDLAPADAVLRNSFGLVLALLGEAEAAAASFRMALMLDPGDAAVWSNLGNAECCAGHR